MNRMDYAHRILKESIMQKGYIKKVSDIAKNLGYTVKTRGDYINAYHPDHDFILHVRNTQIGTVAAVGEADPSDSTNQRSSYPSWEGKDTHRVAMMHETGHKDPEKAIKSAHGWAVKNS